MAYNHGQEIAVNEWKMKAQAILRRALWSLACGAILSGVVSLTFGPKRLYFNIMELARARLVFEVRKLPILGLRMDHALALVRARDATYGQQGYWGFLALLFAGVSAATFASFTAYFWRRGIKEKMDQVRRGAELSTPKIHNHIMRQSYRPGGMDDMGRALVLGQEKILVPEPLQYLHFGFAGASGSGKSTAIAEVIEQAMARGDKGFVVDVSGAFYSKFGRPGDHVLSLRDPRAERWDFWHENAISLEVIPAALIEANGEGSSAFFWKGARAVLTSLLRQTKSIEELCGDFQKSIADLRAKLAKSGEISSQVVGEGSGDQAAGILGTTTLDFSFLKELNQHTAAEQEAFSISRWVANNDDSRWVWVIVTEDDVGVTRPLLRCWFDIACMAALKRDAHAEENRHLWLILDELKTVGQLPTLPHILDKGRKYKASVVLGFQAIPQLEKVYGQADAKSILQGLQNQFLFRMSDPDSARYAIDYLGDQEIEQVSIGKSFGLGQHSDRGSINRSTTRMSLILASEIRSLASLTAYVRLSLHQPIKVHFAKNKRPSVNEPARSRVKEQGDVEGEADPRHEEPKPPSNLSFLPCVKKEV